MHNWLNSNTVEFIESVGDILVLEELFALFIPDKHTRLGLHVIINFGDTFFTLAFQVVTPACVIGIESIAALNMQLSDYNFF